MGVRGMAETVTKALSAFVRAALSSPNWCSSRQRVRIPGVEAPETRYAWNGEAALAYQVVGDGPNDFLFSLGWISNIEVLWEHPLSARFLRALSRNRRLILMDARGQGCSERGSPYDVWPLETLMQDTLAVLDCVDSDKAFLLGTDLTGAVSCMFAATYPDRTSGLVLYESAANYLWSEETPWEWTEEQFAALEPELRQWGSDEAALNDVRIRDPSLVSDQEYLSWWRRLQAGTCTPGYAVAMNRKYMRTDIRSIVDTIHVPALVLYRQGTGIDWGQSARFLAERIPGARSHLLPGRDASLWAGDAAAVIDAINVFTGRVREEVQELERVLATVLFTDIVGSTEKLAALGNAGWRELVERHHARVRTLLERFRGTEVDTAGDGFFASFDGPARAIRCAQAISEEVKALEIEIRAGVHTGECELIDGKVGGMAVNIGARVAAVAQPSEVLVSQTVKDLVAGAGLEFDDRGEHELKGVDGPWRLWRVVG